MTKVTKKEVMKGKGIKGNKVDQEPTAWATPRKASTGRLPTAAVGPKPANPIGTKSKSKSVKKESFRHKLVRRVSLPLFLLLYTLLGGVIFHLIEGKAEDENMELTHVDLNTTLAELCKQMAANDTAACMEESRDILLRGEDKMKMWKRVIRYGVRRQTPKHWTYMGSVFFSSTVYTAIGYGNQVPESVAGEVATMVYATFGIPFVLLVLSDLGFMMERAFTKLFTFMAHGIFRMFLSQKLEKHIKIQATGTRCCEMPMLFGCAIAYLYLVVGAGLFLITETQWSYYEAFYFCFQTLTTIGFGDITPKSKYYVLFSFLYIIIGLAFISMCTMVVQRGMADLHKRLFGTESEVLEAKLKHRY